MSHQFLYRTQCAQIGSPLNHASIFRFYHWILNHSRNVFFWRTPLVDLCALETSVTCYTSFYIEPRMSRPALPSLISLFFDATTTYWISTETEFSGTWFLSVYQTSENWCNMLHQFLYSPQSHQTRAPVVYFVIFGYDWSIVSRSIIFIRRSYSNYHWSWKLV